VQIEEEIIPWQCKKYNEQQAFSQKEEKERLTAPEKRNTEQVKRQARNFPRKKESQGPSDREKITQFAV